MKCFKCPKDFNDVDTFFSHVQNTHGIKGTARCTCTLCFKLFGDWSVYKRHVQTCSIKGMVTDEDSYKLLIAWEFNEELDHFNDSLMKHALLLTLKMCSKPNFPRSAAFDIITEFTLYLKKITDGLRTVIMPKIENCKILLDFISSVETSFDRIDSESKLNRLLHNMDLTKPLIKIDVALNKRMDVDEDSDEDSDECAGDSADESDNEGAVELEHAIVKAKCTLVIMPLANQIKQFFELPNVFAKIQAHTAAILAQPTLNHFIKGTVWQSKISNYAEDEIVIPYNFYGDGVQINNVLGPHTQLGLANFNYITFPTIPPEYQSRLKNILVASLYQEKTIKEYGTKAVFGHILRELAAFAHDGLVININNQSIKVYLLLGIYEGDNKDCNRSLDYPDSHTAIHYCRFCRMDNVAMSQKTEEEIEFLRTEENYFQDVMTNSMTLTGVKDWSVFNTMPYFHVVNGTTNDLTHDILLGVEPYCHKGALKRLILKKNRAGRILSGYFTVDELNKRIKSFNYGPDGCGNKPPPISEKNLNKKGKKKVKMNAAEMFNFTQNITFIIGGLIPEEGEDGQVDPVWEFVKKVVKLHDLCFLPWYEPEDLVNLSAVIQLVLEDYKQLFEELKPVFHYLIHYPMNIKKYGPSRYLQTIRKEGKHKEIKMYTKNSNNRINISLSVAKKVQYSNAIRVYSSEGLEDIITTSKLYMNGLKNKPYFRNIKASKHKDIITARECNFTSKVQVNGITFTTDLWLPDFTNKDNPKIYKVGDIVVMDETDISSIYLICKVYDKISYEDHFVAHSVDLGSVQSHLEVISLKEYLVQHQYPVVTHSTNGKQMFRCKRF